MSCKPFKWPDEVVEQAVAIVRQHDTVKDALAAISAWLGRPVSRSALDQMLQSKGRGSTYQTLRKPWEKREEAAAPAEEAPRAEVRWCETTEPGGPETAAEKPSGASVEGLDWDEEDAETVARTPAIPDHVHELGSCSVCDTALAAAERASAPPKAPQAPSKPAETPTPPPSAPAVEKPSDYVIHRLRTQLSEAEAKNKRLLDERHDLEQRLAALSELGAARPLPPIEAPKGRGEGKQRVGCAVMLCSDWHVEEPVYPESVAGLNEYNLEIADACITKLADAYEWLAGDKRFDVRHGIIWLGGDLFSGYIHEELVEQNFLSPTEATLWLQERIERMLRKILAASKLEKLFVICNDGNHGRTTNKIRISTRTANSLEWLMYKNLASRMRDEPRIQWHIADGEYSYFEVYGQSLCFFHGDSVRYQGGVGGLLIPMKRGLNELRRYKRVDHFAFGHFHTRVDLPDMTGNGSMIGINAYAMSKKMQPEPRQQSFFMLDSERGKCVSAPVWL